MNKRSFKRVTYRLYAKFFSGEEMCTAVVKNLSKNGMRIDSKLKLPSDPKFQLSVHLKDHVIKVSAKMRRIIIKGDSIEGIAVVIENPSKEYLEFFDRELHCQC